MKAAKEKAEQANQLKSAFLPNLFEPFTRSDEQKNTDGTGLGPAITQNLTEVMGGDIDVESEKGVGTTFTIRLPASV